MNQPNLSVMAPKMAPVADSPDIMALVRRYIWLLLGGAVLGAAGSGGYYLYALRNQAEYTARIPFQVLPPPSSIGKSDSPTIVMNPEDTAAVINRQKMIFEQEPFLKRIMATDEFHPADKTPAETPWITNNKYDIMKAAKRDLVVVPRVNAAAFEITFTSRDAAEAQKLVQAAAKEYLSYLQADSSIRKTQHLKVMGDAVRKADETFQIKSEALADYAKRQQIDVLKAGFEIQKNALQGLNDDYTKADALAASAQGQLNTFQSRMKAQLELEQAQAPKDGASTKTKSDLDNELRGRISDVLLSLEMKQYIENDNTLRTLLNTRMSWEQEKAAELSKPSPGKVRLGEIDARLKEIDGQVDKARLKLKVDALDRMEKTLTDEAGSKRGLADYIGDIRKKKEDEVNTLGQRLLQWDQRVSDLKEQQALVNKMREQLSLEEANRFTDDTRVQQMGEEPAIPSEPSWPKWYMFIPLGTAGGLGLAALLAYMLVLADTRVRTPRDISRTLQLPMLGFVPDENDDRILSGDVETAILNSPSSMVAESFRQIRSHITAQTAHNPVNTLVVASIAPGGGATTVAANLAAAMALNDLRVLLVDANFYQPHLDRVFKEIPDEGLTDVIANPQNLNAAIVPHGQLPRLHLMGAGGKLQGASSEVFESRAFKELLELLKSKYDLIIFDGAPLNLVSDSLSLASRVDGVVSVVRAGEVSRGMVTRVRDQIRGVHANLLGFVLNAAKVSNTGYFKEKYKSFHQYAGKGSRNPGA